LINLSLDIQRILENYIYREKVLLDQLTLLKKSSKELGTKLVKNGLSLGVGELASWLFDSSRVRRYGRGLTKRFLDQQIKEQRLVQERAIEHQHNVTVLSLTTFLASISIWKRNLNKPNSKKLIARLDRAQNYVRLSTRIINTIKMIVNLTSESLIYNHDIPLSQIEEEIIIPPSKPYTGMKELKKILSSADEYVKIIDPYISEITLDILLATPEGLPILVITSYTGGIEKEKRLIRACKKFKEERPKFEIRKCDPTLIHDRFILTKTRGWSVGSSLKDVGKKLSLIKTMTLPTKNKMHRFFEDLW